MILVDLLGVYEAPFDDYLAFELVLTFGVLFGVSLFIARALICLDVIPSDCQLGGTILHDHDHML